jgi:hypothetical protein
MPINVTSKRAPKPYWVRPDTGLAILIALPLLSAAFALTVACFPAPTPSEGALALADYVGTMI